MPLWFRILPPEGERDRIFFVCSPMGIPALFTESNHLAEQPKKRRLSTPKRFVGITFSSLKQSLRYLDRDCSSSPRLTLFNEILLCLSLTKYFYIVFSMYLNQC